jgi:hypothetical protein
MIRRLAMMLAAFVAGFPFSAAMDSANEAPTSPVAQHGKAQAHRSSEHSTTTQSRPAASDQGAAKPAEAPPAGAPEVKTADVQVLTQKYIDGQATAVTSAIPSQAVGQADPATALVATEPAGPDPAVASAEAEGEPAAPTLHPTAPAPHEPVAQTVYTDYRAAMQVASEDRKMLFIYFHERWPNAAQRSFEKLTLADRGIKEKLARYVLLRLPRDASIVMQGKQVRLLSHPAFAEMLGRQGVAILDFAHADAEYYGRAVSTFPFTPGKFYTKDALSIILDLPPGTLTQRTMIYAVRIHPESPASTQGIFHTALADEAKDHADHQASILVQGHHSWESRFHRINAKLPSGVVATEVVAESWPNEGLVEAAVDCVHSWRQSPGHWGQVRGRHAMFGYDIKRGRNGIWYATGIFGRLFGRD